MGVSLGFLAAIAPSCGPAKNCGPANCAGCCDAAGTCVAGPANGNNTSCGTSGGSGGSGGGSGGCNSSNCNGCCAGSACIPLNSTSSITCGSNGSACQACGAGQNCSSGACVTPDAGSSGGIGDACSVNGDCVNVPTTSGGGPAFCKKNAMVFDGVNTPTNGYAYPGGMCTRRCTSNTQCGTNGRCVFYLGFLGDMENVCLASCASAACRTGYICVNFGTTAQPLPLCIVAAPDGGLMDEWDAGRPANDNVMGQSCANDVACQPPASGTCIPALLPDGGQSGFPGGSCTADCSMATFDTFCGSDAGACVPSAYSTAQGPLVLWSCERLCNPLQGNTGCRTEYYCDAIYGTAYPDYGICTPKCTNAGITCPSGTACNTTTGVCG